MMEPLVIVGTGLAGYTLAREWRKRERDRSLVMVSRDDGAFYSKPMLSNALAQDKTPEALINATAEEMAARLDAEIRTGCTVTGLDPDARRLDSDQGPIGFGQRVLALGADPIRLPIGGSGADAILSVNDRLDYARFRAALRPGARVAIIGAGLIGCEFANDLLRTGHPVSVIDLAARPLGRLAPPAVAEALGERFAKLGVDWHLGTSVDRVDRNDGGLRVTLADGSALDADLVLSAVGLRPRIALARQAGLDTRRGIRVDRFLRTSHPDIHALGDCAEVEGLVLPFVMPLMAQARALAATLAGEPTPVHYPAMPVVVKTPDFPLVVAPPADGAPGDWTIESADCGLRALFHDPQGRLLGFVLTDECVHQRAALTRQLPATLE